MSENIIQPSVFSLSDRTDNFLNSFQHFRITNFCCPADLSRLYP